MQELAGEWKRRLLDAIAHEAYRHSSEAEIARRAELHPRFLSQARRRGRIQLDQAFALIAALGHDPGSFIARTLGPGRAPAPESTPAPAPEAPPGFVRRAYTRAQSRLPATIPRAHLEYLSSLRESDPPRVLRAVEACIDHIAPVDVPLALGIWSTGRRLAFDYSAAAQALDAGLELAENDPATQGVLLLKREVLIKRQSYDWVAANRVAQRVALLAEETRNRPLLGQALAAQMINARLLEDPERAIDLGERALELLPRQGDRFTFLSTLELALNYGELGLIQRSAQVLADARRGYQPSTPWERVWQRWFEAGIQDTWGNPSRAADSMPAVFETMLRLDSEKAADAALDLGVFIGRQGDEGRAATTVRRLLDRSLSRTVREEELHPVLEELPSRYSADTYDRVRDRVYGVLQSKHRPLAETP